MLDKHKYNNQTTDDAINSLITEILMAKEIDFTKIFSEEMECFQQIEKARVKELNRQFSGKLPELTKELLKILLNYEEGRDAYLGEKIKQVTSSALNFFLGSSKSANKSSLFGINGDESSNNNTVASNVTFRKSDLAEYSLDCLNKVRVIIGKMRDFQSFSDGFIEIRNLCSAENLKKSPHLYACLTSVCYQVWLHFRPNIQMFGYYFGKYSFAEERVEACLSFWDLQKGKGSFHYALYSPGYARTIDRIYLNCDDKQQLSYQRFDVSTGWVSTKLDYQMTASDWSRIQGDASFPEKLITEMYEKELRSEKEKYYAEFNYEDSVKSARLALSKTKLAEDLRCEINSFTRHYFNNSLASNNPKLVIFGARLEEYYQVKAAESHDLVPSLFKRHDGSFWQPRDTMIQGLKQQLMSLSTDAGVTNIDVLLNECSSFQQALSLMSGGKFLGALKLRLHDVFLTPQKDPSLGASSSAGVTSKR